MKLEEAIKHCEEVAILNENTCKAKPDSNLKKYKKCAEEHRQLAEWLKELKQLREQTQEPCEDCVSRAELKKWLDMNFSFGGTSRKFELFDRLDKELPSVTPTIKWIPVSEKMPNPGEYNGDVDRHYLVQNEYDDMLVARYTKKECWEQIFQIGEIKEKIVAWQPLPKPYEEKE